MLKRLHANNFRSLLNFEFRPEGLNLLIGPNNAGKTNLCSVLRFLSLTSRTPLENAAKQAVGETWSLANVYVEKREVQIEVDCHLVHEGEKLDFNYLLHVGTTRDPPHGRSSLQVIAEVLKLSGGDFLATALLDNQSGQARLMHEERFIEGITGSDAYVETLAPQNATMLSQLYDLATNRRANLFKRYLQSWSYYNLVPDAIRSPAVLRDTVGLRHDGANFSRTLYELHNEKPRLERKIIEATRAVEPKLDLFSYSSPDPESVYFFLEDEKGNRFSAQSISDGTLRFLAMAHLVLQAANPEDGSIATSLVMIEEPENGLYVGHLKGLVEQIDPSGNCGQFVFSSHNPYFIDLFDVNLSGVHLLRPGIPSTIIARPNADKVRKLMEEMSLGELHFRELLG